MQNIDVVVSQGGKWKSWLRAFNTNPSYLLLIYNHYFTLRMIKSLSLIILLLAVVQTQRITPYYILPVETTQSTLTSYNFLFQTDTNIPTNAQVAIKFPFEFSPNALTQASRVRYALGTDSLVQASWSLSLYTFTIELSTISKGNITIVIDNVLNPTDYTASSFFVVQALFKNVVVTSNSQFGRTPFTAPPVATSGGQFFNHLNRFIEQGASWAFQFTPSRTYPANSSLRFIFPEGFSSNGVQCNVSGVVDPRMVTRVFPSSNVYDCLNLNMPLTGTLRVILSGLVNPNYETTVTGVKVHILQPNNLIVQEVISSSSSVLIQNKPLNATVTIPNQYRNNSVTYIFQINTDTNLYSGDYIVFTFTGLWTLFTNATTVVEGVTSSPSRTARWQVITNSSASTTTLRLTNFSSILKSSQFTFEQPLVTPLLASTYTLTIQAFRQNGGLAQTYSRPITINATTGYIKEMKLHPMQSPIKLPVGKTGPIEIVLFLRNNLPKTNVLTYGQIVIDITPNIPAPIVALNGVPKCYFYYDIPAANCSFDSSNPAKTVVTIFTPVDFNFQQSEIPLTITTEGFQQPENQGITIDTLVKRYFFEIQFYSHLRPKPIPLEVIFDEWIPDSIPMTTLSCDSVNRNVGEYDHIKCSFVTPNQVLNADGHIHFFRVQFGSSSIYSWNIGWVGVTNSIVPDYPCLMYGTNISANPYVRCDYVTWQSGPYKSSQLSTSYNYITFYGLSTLPGGSTVTFQIPRIQRNGNSGYETNLKFSILQDTPGYTSPIVYIYTQTVIPGSNTGGGTYIYNTEYPSITLSNSVINKITNITLNNYNLGTTSIEEVIFQVDQTGFPNIGRGKAIACGTHSCSKFDKPIQYFILYPTTTLGSSATLMFPDIATPPYSGDFTFRTRIYKSGGTVKKAQFTVTITPEPITVCSYAFAPNQTITTLYPNSDHFYTINWTTVNPLVSGTNNPFFLVQINNVFTLSSTYCQLTTSASAADGRGITCELTAGGTSVYLKYFDNVAAGSSFSLTLQLRSTSTAASVSPTVTIKTYYGNGNVVDQAVNVPFSINPLSNTNLDVFTAFTLPSQAISTRSVTAGYFGDLLINFDPDNSATVINGSKIVVRLPTGFQPVTNALGLPISCKLNGVRFSCTYTINPFVITITGTNSSFTTGVNILNITTEYQNTNGIYFPSSPGRYLLDLQIMNNTSSESLERVQQLMDILPKDVGYFNVSWAHKDIGVHNIFTVEFKNGPDAIPAYNDGANPARIYIGFPTINSNNDIVFASDLGFTGIKEGDILPCFFETASGFVGPISGSSMQCKISKSYVNNYYVWIEIVNFVSIPAGGLFRVIIGKIMNPGLKQIDINFVLKINRLDNTNVQTPIYYTTYNMFIDMVASSITNRNELNSSTIFFEAGASVGDTNKFFNISPYSAGSFLENDWWIVDLDTQFPLSGNIFNCQKPFYQYCIIYPTINWLAVKIGNGTLIPLQPFISQLPLSISRVDTYFNCYTFRSGRWSETIRYTITADYRWLELRGTISNFKYQVVGSQNKLNIGQKNVEVLVYFKVQHKVPKGGSIEIQFPSNSTTVPAIKQHCRSAVTMGSKLYGYDTGKPSVNVQGEIGCTVQFDSGLHRYSWIITGFAELAANSQVIIYGRVDFPTAAVYSLGMGYVCTYSSQHATNTFANGKTIDYLQTNYPIQVQNLTWSLDSQFSMLKTAPLRVGYTGQLKFYLNLDSTFQCSSFGTGNSGQIYLNLYRNSITDYSGGFGAPPSTIVCTIFNPSTLLKYGCGVNYYEGNSDYYGYQILSYQNLPANTLLQVTITSLAGSGTEGIPFPTSAGTYKTELEINYCDSCTNNKAQAQYIEVYGPNWSTLNFNSSVTIPSENNLIIVIFSPPSSITTTQQVVIQIPTVALDGTALFPADLGMGYKAYDNLVFDLFQSSISSMECKVYPGDQSRIQPTKIVCSKFSATITSSMTVKFGFWVINPSSSVSMAIPIQIYGYDQPSGRKFIWSIIEGGIRVLPITVTPISDDGNFVSSNAVRQAKNTDFSFTARNTKAMVRYDWYILKFEFDLRQSANSNNNFLYNSGLGSTGDVIFMEKCRTVMLRVGVNNLAIISPGSTTINAKINSLFYNPPHQLTPTQSSIKAYAIYNSRDQCERIYYSDPFPSLVPQEPTSPTFTITPVYALDQMGMSDDWQIQFTMSSSAGNSSSLVKLISIQFPSSSVSDVVLQSRQCVQHLSSTIEVHKCLIDIDNRVIWVTPVIKNTYTDSSTLVIQTAGLAIRNPITLTTNANQFTVRYYTWPTGQSQPTISPNSDNWCFMKQDSSRIGSSNLPRTDYTSTYYSQHSYLEGPESLYVNQWQPADYFFTDSSYQKLRKAPFQFKLISPSTFNSLEGTSNYHFIQVDYGTIYSTPTLNQLSMDLYLYTPVCLLNGFSILSCSITGNTIKMSFQQSIANGATIGVTFNIVNPKDEGDQGFILSGISNPTITLPVLIYNYNAGTTYYVEPDPFHTFYKATSSSAAYPSYGIQDVGVIYGTQVQGQLNYLQFAVTLTRTDINGFVIEIPVINSDGIRIYSNPTLMGLQSGSQYPCSLGPHVAVYCYYEKGSLNGFGSSTRIYVTGFTLGSTSFNLRMLFTNPDNPDVFPSFTWKAFGGSFSPPDLMGKELKGIHTLIDPFKVYPTTNYYSTGSLNCYPTKALYQKGTNYDCYTASENMGTNTYAIMKWPLVDPTYGTIGDYDYVSSQTYDHFFMFQDKDKYFVYIVKKLTGGFNANTNGHSSYAPFGYITSYYRFGQLRMKHHIVNSYPLYLLGKPTIKIYTASVTNSFIQDYRVVNAYGQLTMNSIDTQVKISGYNGWQFASINAGNAMSAYSSDPDDPSEKVVEIQFNAGTRPYSTLSSTTTDCVLESGLIGNDPLNPITCYLDRTNNRILFFNVFWFTSTCLNFYYYATTNSDQENYDVLVTAWANPDAYNTGNWKLFSSQTDQNWNYDPIYYASNTGYNSLGGSERPFGNSVMDLSGDSSIDARRILTTSNNVRTEGYANVFFVSSIQIKIRLYASTTANFYKAYRTGFRFYTPRLMTTSCSSVSVWTSRWGTNNFNGNSASPGSFSVTCGNGGTNSRRFYAIFYMWYTTSADTYPYQWPNFSNGDTYEFTFTFSSVTNDGTNYPNYLWVSASMLFENSYWYYRESICGCCYQPCCDSSCGYYAGPSWDRYWVTTCCYTCCVTYCNCRRIEGWDYYTFTGTQSVGFSQSSNSLASSTAISLVSNQYGVQTELGFYLQNHVKAITDKMVSTTNEASAQLVIQLSGNTNYPSNNPFPYTDATEPAASIECLCRSQTSGFSVSASTVFSPANCTRYIISGMNPFFTVRFNSPANRYLRCYFPGFRTPSSSSSSITATFHWNHMHFFNRHSLPRPHYSSYQSSDSVSLTSTGTSNPMHTVDEGNLFWESSGTREVNQVKQWYLYLRSYATDSNPIVYYSSFYPQLSQSACNSGSFSQCRVYASFTNRRYFMVAMRSGSTSTATFNYNAVFPQSKDSGSSYNRYIGWTRGSYSSYYSIDSTSKTSGNMSEATPSYDVTVPIYGHTVKTYSTLFVVSVDLNGFKLYSNQRTSGPFEGSFIKLTTSSFSALFGCGAYLYEANKPVFANNAIYCKVISSTVINIWSNYDIAFTGKLIITLSTSSVPSSTTFTFELYDRYISSSDYGRSVYVTKTISNNPGSYSMLPSTSIVWRRMAYKQLRTDSGPVRITLNNNYQYVSVYNMSTNSQNTAASNGIIVLLPVTLSASTSYKCLVREYPPTQYHLYTEYPISCSAYSNTQVIIKSIPSHILTPDYRYSFTIYQNAGSSSSLITASSATNFYHMRVWSGTNYASFNTIYFDVISVNKYLNAIPITLNGIYILTREAATTNSLLVDFTVAQATPSNYDIQIVLEPLSLTYFGIVNGQEIPCYISGLSGASGRAEGVTCFGFAPGANQTSPVIVRVVNFGSFSANRQIKIAFDNFNNPPIQKLFIVPINLRVSLRDTGSQRVYTSYFPNVYYSDSINVRNTGTGTGTLTQSNGLLGDSGHLYWNVNWPYSSGSNAWDKLVFKINGGATCCSSFSSLATISNNYTTLTQIWVNTKANTSVYVLPTISQSTSIRMYVNNVNNPNAVSYNTYIQGLTASFTYYSLYQTFNIYSLTQPAYASYTKQTDFTITGAASYIAPSRPAHYYSHQYYPITYEFNWNLDANSYNSRNLSYIILQFTGGVRWIDSAWFRYHSGSINALGSAQIGFNSGSSQWFINITGVQDSVFQASQNWYLRVRLYATNANYISYASYLYNYNGQQQFTTSTGAFTPSSSASFSTNGQYGTPNLWTYQHLRYTHNYYELQRTTLYAAAALTTNKLFFKFRTPYAISEVQSFSFISSSSSYPSPATPNNGIYCIIQPTYSSYVSYGTGLYAPCSYNSPIFTVNAPSGGLAVGQEYLLTVIDRQQLTTTFNMPPSPTRIEISLIYNNILNLAYGDVYTLDFAGYMTSYSVDHAHLMSTFYDMLGFTFRPSFPLAAASTSSPITESILSFQIESKYYDKCLNIDGVFSPSDMLFYSGVQYSHYASYPVSNANARIMCGNDSQAQNWAPAILSITDYGALSTSTDYYFRFPLITLPSGTNVPLTYRVQLLSYANGVPYSTIISQYDYEAKDRCTGATNNDNHWADLSLSSNVVQNTMLVSFSYRFTSFTNGAQTLVKFKNNYIPAITSLSTLTSISQGGFSYQYYPNINLCSYKRTSGGSTSSFSLGSYPTSTQQQNFQLTFVQTFSGTTRMKGWFNSGSNVATYTVNAASSWSSSAFSKGSNLLGTNSWDKYTLSWSANYLTFPEGSYMIITISNYLSLVDQYCHSYSGFLPGVNANSNLVCKRYSSNQIIIAGYATLAPNAALSITFYMAINSGLTIDDTYSTYATIRVVSSNGNNIIQDNSASVTFTLANIRGCTSLNLANTMNRPYSSGSTFPLYVSFALKSHTLTNGDYLEVNFGDWILDTATTGVQVFKYQLAGNKYWVPSAASRISGNIFRVPVYNNYSMTAGTSITLWIDTFAPTTYYGAQIANHQWNQLQIKAYRTGVLVEQQVFRVWTEPYAHASFSVTPVLNYVGAITLYEFTVTPNVSAKAGDTILIEFTTGDGLKSSLFSNTLGATIPYPNPGKLDCSQAYNTRVISNNVIACRVYQGSSSASPTIPTTIAIPITKDIPANTQIKFNILNIVNPTERDYPIGIVFKLSNTCSWSDTNNLCAYYKSVTYRTFSIAPAAVGTTTTGSLTFNPSRVSASNTVHTVSAGYDLSVGDWVKIIYYSQIPIPTVCSLTSNNGECYSYPSTNTIMIKATSAQSNPYSFSLGGMTNPYQNFYGTNTFYTQIWKSGSINRRFYSSYQATTITSDPTSSNQLAITFTPTLTPDYELKYGFNNIAKINITHMLQNKQIQQIYITTGSEITLDTQYCNATMQTYPGQALPYPYRFVCASMGSQWVRLNLQSDFPSWTTNFTGRSILIYLRYTISNSQVAFSNYWTAYAYTDPTSTSWYNLVSQATGRFPIVQYLLPYLYVISLWTKSFQQRTCRINQQCMFYGFLLPTTPSNQITIRSMTFMLPRQFNYTTTRTLSKCSLQPTTTSLWSFSCDVSRNNSQITIGYNPPGGAYNQWYNLVSLDHSDSTMLFTAPSFPGNHYQMQVNLWSSSNALVESQYINLTTVYGYYLSVPNIVCKIPADGGAKGLIDLTFLVGSADILPSYESSSSNSVTSSIELSFANTFSPDLGTGLKAGDQIACLSIQGLTFNTMGRITCRIYPSVSTITYPTIIITGYDRVLAGTTIRIQLANLQTLPTGVTDYCKLGVALTYYNYGGVKGYIYEPVSFVVGPPTAPATPKAITFTISEVGTNIVGQLTNYSFTGSIANGFATVSSNDYLVVEFPPYIFEGRFNLNTQALCTLGSNSKCSVFGLASQIYIQPASPISSSSIGFTINNLLNAAYSIMYVNQTVTLKTIVNGKVDASGSAIFLKLTQTSPNASAIITSIDSIYGGDSGINYYFSFQLNSYLPQEGKISIFFPKIFTSLFTVNSRCFFRQDSQLRVGSQAYCSVINSHQLVIVPNGVLLSQNLAYYINVTKITNPNSDLTGEKFSIETYYFSNVYNPAVISRSTFGSPTLSLINVKECKLQASLSIYNPQLPAQYQLSIICPSSIREASELKVYLSWAPSLAHGTCTSDAATLYSTQCNILQEYNGTTKLIYLSIYLRQISAQKLVTITGTITNGIQGTYTLRSTIGYNGFVYMQAVSNSFYITSSSSSTSATAVTSSTSGTIITGSGQAISIRSANYPLNRQYSSIYTFAITRPSFIVSTLHIDLPSIITSSAGGISCGSQLYNPDYSYFDLMIREGTNKITCEMIGQKIVISGLSNVLGNLRANSFVYLTVNGLLNPKTSVRQTNFTFTFVNTSSTFTQAVLLFSVPLSYTVSNPPSDMQIKSIVLSNNKYLVNSLYTFSISTVNGASLTIAKDSQLGIMVHFPAEYQQIWTQISIPEGVNMTIGSNIFTAGNVTLGTRYLFARFQSSAFSSQLDFTTLSISFIFRNPNKSVDCTVLPVFTISLFDFKGKNIYSQTLSNQEACPKFSTHLYSINVTGNTKISAGSSSSFFITLEKPAQNLVITPSCVSSAISFSPQQIVFERYSSTKATFNITAANGLSGQYNVTFAKTQGGVYTFYNDIQFITLNVYVPSTKYYIRVNPFVVKSIGSAIKVTISLQVASPTSFALVTATNCSSDFVFNPSGRITIPAQTTNVTFTVTYTSTTIPNACSQNFTISSLTTNNYYFQDSTVYYSSSLSIDKTWVKSPMLLELSTTPKSSSDVGHTVYSMSSNTSVYSPTVYKVTAKNIGSNSATFTAVTSYIGTVYFAVVAAGTPHSRVTQSEIYNKSLTSGATYGSGEASLQNQGVNIDASLIATSLSAQTSYILAVYLNSTVGNSPIFFLNFKTSKASNAAAIKIAMSTLVNETHFIDSLSKVLRINSSRIYILTNNQTLAAQQARFTSSVMNQRYYIYDTLIAPDPVNDVVSPKNLLNQFAADANTKNLLAEFVPEYIKSYSSPVREVFNTVPRVRVPIKVIAKTFNSVTFKVAFWAPAFVYAVIIENSNGTLLSSQIVNGLNENNTNVIPQHYKNVTSQSNGQATIIFDLLSDNSSYSIFVSAQCPLPFAPRLALADSSILKAIIKTSINPNLQKNQNQAIEAIASVNPALAAEAQKMNRFVEAQKKIHGVDKTKRERIH